MMKWKFLYSFQKEAVSNYVEYNDELFSKEHVSECDSEEETDYYWSDDLG